MLKDWETLKSNWEGRGYDVVAISPKFPPPTYPLGLTEDSLGVLRIPFWGSGTGKLIVDYRATSRDFWAIVKELKPIAIMSFSRGDDDKSWELEGAARNLPKNTWIIELEYYDHGNVLRKKGWQRPFAGGSPQDYSPYRNTRTISLEPPDPKRAANTKRKSTLPNANIKAAVNAYFKGSKVIARIDNTGDVGGFVSEYMAYHVAWYAAWSTTLPAGQRCLKAGHTHVGTDVWWEDGAKAVRIQLRELIKKLPAP